MEELKLQKKSKKSLKELVAKHWFNLSSITFIVNGEKAIVLDQAENIDDTQNTLATVGKYRRDRFC